MKNKGIKIVIVQKETSQVATPLLDFPKEVLLKMAKFKEKYGYH